MPILAATLHGVAGMGEAAEWKPGNALANPEQHVRIYKIGRAWGDERYDDAVGLVRKDPDRPRNYMIRESAYYAYGLLLTGDPEDRARAEKIIRAVLAKQDLRKDQPTYGAFLPMYEDKWETATNVDLNFCAFVGSALAGIIDLDNQQNHVLPADLRKQLDDSLRLAVDAIIRRDVEPGYTNIALLSAAVCAAGDKLLGIPGASDYAMSKIAWFLTRASQPNIAMREYLAPTYFGVDLGAAYMLQRFAATPELEKAANRTIDALWKDVAASYHAPTYQLAGPHSRAYGENMLEYAAGLKYFLYFALDGNYPLSDVETKHNWDAGGLTMVADLPVTVRPEFQERTAPWREVPIAGGNGMAFRQFRKGDFVLGSINTQSLWQQQRSVVAYWPVAKPAWHVAFCMDMSAQTFGNGSVNFRSTQSGSAVLASLISKLPLQPRGGLQIGFNGEAQVVDSAGGSPSPSVVRDGDVTAYIYPVTRQDGAAMTSRKDEEANRLYVERSWNAADTTAKAGILSYLLVFQLPGEGKPEVSDISFQVADEKATVSAKVNGTLLSLDLSK